MSERIRGIDTTMRYRNRRFTLLYFTRTAKDRRNSRGPLSAAGRKTGVLLLQLTVLHRL